MRLQTTLAAALLVCFAATARGDDAAQAEKPNVLVIAVDDLNDWVGVLGGHPQARTPNIDRLARRGMLFTNAHCQAPICNPSRPSLLTGMLPSSTGLYFLAPDFRESEQLRDAPTLPQHFAEEGYETLGVGKIFHGRDNRYFQQYGGNNGGFGPRPKQKISYPEGHPLWDWGAFPESDAQMPDSKAADWAVARLGEQRTKPFLLAVGFYRPHVPMYAPQKWFDLYPLESIQLPEVPDDDRDDLPAYGRDLTIGYPAPRHEWFVEHHEWKHAVQAYLACVSFADHCVGRVLDALDASGAAEDTIIVLFSDHGWHLGEKEHWAKRSLWERATRVPLIIVAPEAKPGSRCDRPVGLIDIYPTLQEICGLRANPRLEGQSLRPLLSNPQTTWERPALTTFGPNCHTLRSQNWRYIRYADGSEELYDHRSDPNEWHNLAGDPKYADVLAAHARWLPKVNVPPVKNVGGTGYQAYLEAEQKRKARRSAASKPEK